MNQQDHSMKNPIQKQYRSSIALIVVISFTGWYTTALGQQKIISFKNYRDRCEAIWAAQITASLLTRPFRQKPKTVATVKFYDQTIYDQLKANGGVADLDDSWYLEYLHLEAFEEHGPDLSLEELSGIWADNNTAYSGLVRIIQTNVKKGIPAAQLGLPDNNPMWFHSSIQAQSEIYGMLLPGMPETAASVARRLGHIYGYAEGTDGAAMMAGIVALAFFEFDPRVVLKKAVPLLDSSAPHRQCLELVIRMAESFKSPQAIAKAVLRTFGPVSPETGTSVADFGITAIALWYGEGHFINTINLALSLADYTDNGQNAACAGAVLGAMHGMRVIPRYLIKDIHGHVHGDRTETIQRMLPLDIDLKDLARRSADMGVLMMFHWGKMQIKTEELNISIEENINSLPPESFSANDYVKKWNPDWFLKGAGYSFTDAGRQTLRGRTFVDSGILSVYPANNMNLPCLYRKLNPEESSVLKCSVGADPGYPWQLEIYVDNKQADRARIIGNNVSESGNIQAEPHFENVTLDLATWAGQGVIIRLFMRPVPGTGRTGNALWRSATVE